MFNTTFSWALTAVFGVAMCNGIAAILQKSGADSQPTAHSLNPGLPMRLARNWQYVLGTMLDLVSGGLIIFAVHTLPLFLAQSIIASSVSVTFCIERFILHRYSSRQAYFAIGLVVIGLILVSSTAAPEQITAVSNATKWGIALALLPIIALAAICSRYQNTWTAPLLGILSGISFGGTSVVARVLVLPHTWWHIILEPLVYIFAAYGAVALLVFTIGLQRTTATALVTVMVTAQTIVPAIVGVLLFDDHVHPGAWPFAISGVLAAAVGTILLSQIRQRHLHSTN